MKYLVCEGTPDGAYNASSKARNDIENILDTMNFERIYIDTKNGVQKNKLLKPLQIISYLINNRKWNSALKKFNKNDVIVIQYPITNTILGLKSIVKKFSKRTNIVILIHDMDSIRRFNHINYGKIYYHRVKKEDTDALKAANFVIVHNEKMKEKLIEFGNNEDKLANLNIFDYLVDNDFKYRKHKKEDPIIIAGNLSKEKAKYLAELKDVKNISFNLYGKGYKKSSDDKNITYKGAFLPDELLKHLEGSFGLVWDGVTKNTCAGSFGEYLRYNNPHKTSLYLVAGIPVIVWKEAALSEFVIENNVGIVVSNLDEIHNKINNLSDTEYENMLKNAQKISKKLRNGEYFKCALKDILIKIEGKNNEKISN